MTRKIKRGRGRPPKAVSEARPRAVMVRLHDEELARLTEGARRAGKPLATYVRDAALATASP